jgi:small subunit ribosomal protein S17
MAKRKASKAMVQQAAQAHGVARKPRRTKTGRVTSNKMDKTVVVSVEHLVRHPLYRRTVRRTRKFKAHDEYNQCEIGDIVVIAESRALSRDKHWVLQRIVRRGTGEPVELVEVEA